LAGVSAFTARLGLVACEGEAALVHGRNEVLRLLAAGTLRVDEAAELLDRVSTDGTAALEVRRASDGKPLLRAVVPAALVAAAAAADLRLALRVGEPPLAIAWRDLAAQAKERGVAEARDDAAGIVALLRPSAPAGEA
jgi:hypothetical protein